MEFLKSRPWRGNVRELQNVVEHLVVFAQAGCEIELDHLPLDEDWARGSLADSSPAMSNDILDNAYHLAKEHVLANFEEEYVTRLVARASGNVSRAARLASVDRTTLYRLLQRHGYRRDASDASLLR
jgi:DNA-binding NtrC family response regulator